MRFGRAVWQWRIARSTLQRGLCHRRREAEAGANPQSLAALLRLRPNRRRIDQRVSRSRFRIDFGSRRQSSTAFTWAVSPMTS